MFKNINLVFLTGSLLVVYFMQGFLYPGGSIISQVILLIILTIGAICFIKTLLHKSIPIPVIIFAFFFLMLLLTYIVSPKIQYGWKYEAIGSVNTFGQFKNACAFSLLYFIGYYSEIKQNTTRKTISIVFILFLISSFSMFFYLRDILLLKMNRDVVTNNAAYKFVVLIPFLPIALSYLKNNYIRIGIIILMTSLIIMGSKRGAILCLLVAGGFFLYYYLGYTKLSVKKLFVVILVLSLGCTFIYYRIEQNEYLMERLGKTQESGIGSRDIAYSVLWNYWYSQSSIFAYLFGNGSSASVSVWGNYAHNDWLELLTDNGLLGVIIYVCLFVSFFLMIRRSSLPFTHKLSMSLCLLIWFLQTCFSMGYTSIGNSVYTLLLGVLTGKNVTIQNEISDNENIIVD